MLTVIEKVHWTRRIISSGLPIILILLFGCQTPVGVSGTYKPTILVLAAPPLESVCASASLEEVEVWLEIPQHCSLIQAEMRERTIRLESRRWFVEVDVPRRTRERANCPESTGGSATGASLGAGAGATSAVTSRGPPG